MDFLIIFSYLFSYLKISVAILWHLNNAITANRFSLLPQSIVTAQDICTSKIHFYITSIKLQLDTIGIKYLVSQLNNCLRNVWKSGTEFMAWLIAERFRRIYWFLLFPGYIRCMYLRNILLLRILLIIFPQFPQRVPNSSFSINIFAFLLSLHNNSSDIHTLSFSTCHSLIAYNPEYNVNKTSMRVTCKYKCCLG